MPIYDPNHVEYSINSGHVKLVLDGGTQMPAYWAYPILGRKFPAIGLIHDWWGLTDVTRGLANLFAQMGYYVIVPDLFDGQMPQSAHAAMELVKGLENHGYPQVHQALAILESHHLCNKHVAAVGMGMGGSLAFEAAITRPDLEAAIAYGGFPQRYLGQFSAAKAPIYAFYGEHEPYTNTATIHKLKKELTTLGSTPQHHVEVIPGMGHELFSMNFTLEQKERSRDVLKKSFAFLDKHLERPERPSRQVY